MPETPPLGSLPVAKRRSVWITAGVTALLTAYLVVSLAASLHKGVSYDEAEQLAVGYNIWTHQDFRMEGADGDLIKRWDTLPYLISRPVLPSDKNEYWREARAYIYGYEFMFYKGNEPEWLLLQARTMAVLLGALTGGLVFYCSRELFGPAGGLCSLLLFVLSPHMLAFGAIVSTDMSTCLVLLGATWSVWRLLHRVTWGRLLVSIAFASLLMLAKLSSLAIFPIALTLVLIKLFSGLPLRWELGRPRVLHSPAAQAGVFAGLLVLHAALAWAVLWAHYDFRFVASPNPANPNITLPHYLPYDSVDPRVASVMNWMYHEHVLPEGFLKGVALLLATNEERQSFMDGQWYFGGNSVFFLHTIWDKTSPALFILAGVGLGWWWWWRRRAGHPLGPVTDDPALAVLPPLYEAMPYVVLIAVFLTIAIIQDVDIGHRHILPIYPPLYILVGGSFACVWMYGRRWLRILLAVLPLYLMAECLTLYPNYLTYFSPWVGGSSRGYQHLVDSSLDWGMDFPAVKEWLDQNDPSFRTPVFLAYFGVDNPDYYGIRATRLPGTPDWRIKRPYALTPGIYILSATLYESVYSTAFGPWSIDYENNYQISRNYVAIYFAAAHDPVKLNALLKVHPLLFWDNQYASFERLRFARLCAWLRLHRPVPDANCANTMLVWRLSQKDLDEAILGRPPDNDSSVLF